MQGDTAISILQRLIDSESTELSTAAAEAVLQFAFSDADQNRMSELAGKSNTGKLSEPEAVEYDSYIAAADLLSLWKSKARQQLKKHSSAA